MRCFTYVLVFSLFFLKINAQNTEMEVLVISIEKKYNGTIHKYEEDFWIIPSWEFKGNIEEIIPLYVQGFSSKDMKECCKKDSLLLFNYTKNEGFPIGTETDELISIIKNNRKKIQSIKKVWPDGRKVKIRVFISPIKGNFCSCNLFDSNDFTNRKIGYNGKVILPISGFSFDSTFWTSRLNSIVKKFDYSKLPFFQLHLIQ